MGWSPGKGRDLGLGPRPCVRGLAAENFERARSSEHGRHLGHYVQIESSDPILLV